MRRSRDVPDRIQPVREKGLINVQPAHDDEKQHSDRAFDYGEKPVAEGKHQAVGLIPNEILAFVKHLEEKAKANEICEKNKEDWEATARVIDRLFFVIFAFVIVISSGVIFGLLQTQTIASGVKEAVRIVQD